MQNTLSVDIHANTLSSPCEEKNKKLISVIIPVFNEEGNILFAYQAVKEVFENKLQNNYDFEIIFTDNHSTDNTYAELQSIAEFDPRVRIARFTRNFGFNKSLLTGYRLARGDAAIQLDCDLQDSPELFDTLLLHWEAGHDVVVGRRSKREEGFLLQNARKFFYRFLKRISEDNLAIDGGDFRLVDRSVLNKLQRIHDATPYVRGLVSMLAARQTEFAYERQARKHGKSKFPLFRLFGLAIDGIVSHSIVPLRLASIIGVIVAAFTFLLAMFYLFGKLLLANGRWPLGFTTQVVLILFSTSLNAVFLGIIGEYLGRIYKQLRYHPITIIEKSINLSLPETE
ncbi:glycosyl transferase, group 2 family protein (plasmid) [Legionella adelaidensis]|uniref:Glycosyl transferase, group 2 family protein n=1 Tax=Legionella adelaidensis TaxID=45056 RepID=A0A0W0R4R1_9GAMM|nr:glycosyltransferase family 2 protein [Legionella adelaidensis]KTC66065.1 glycosyl transferase, group 2 family protein [Legionella adelaidensis]VEH85717.1 glycosyl transferase, group 2 family protein [Legionella adelaidensis]